MTNQFNQLQYSNLGFESEPPIPGNYPDGYSTSEQLDKERKLNIEIIRDNGGEI